MGANTALFLVGPTASGKSALAHHLAYSLEKSVVSADSMNLYRGMDIGTAKPTRHERQQVTYYGIDQVEPSQTSHVADWLAKVKPAWHGESVPIVSGGSGLYLSALIKGLDQAPAMDPIRRKALEKWDLSALQQEAMRVADKGYEQMTSDDQLNPRRLIRLIERGATSLSCWQHPKKATLIGLSWPREVLHARIEQRVEEMYAHGLLEEAQRVVENGLSETAAQAIGYAEAIACLSGKMRAEEAQERTVIRTRQLAKRQMTWFRNQLDVVWVECSAQMSVEQLAQAVEAGWRKTGCVEVAI